jgi:hypothetical protein
MAITTITVIMIVSAAKLSTNEACTHEGSDTVKNESGGKHNCHENGDGTGDDNPGSFGPQLASDSPRN